MGIALVCGFGKASMEVTGIAWGFAACAGRWAEIVIGVGFGNGCTVGAGCTLSAGFSAGGVALGNGWTLIPLNA